MSYLKLKYPCKVYKIGLHFWNLLHSCNTGYFTRWRVKIFYTLLAVCILLNSRLSNYTVLRENKQYMFIWFYFQLTEYEIVIASHLVVPSEIQISWQNIAGLEGVIQELKETVILPIKRKDLFSSSQLTRAPKGNIVLFLPN